MIPSCHTCTHAISHMYTRHIDDVAPPPGCPMTQVLTHHCDHAEFFGHDFHYGIKRGGVARIVPRCILGSFLHHLPVVFGIWYDEIEGGVIDGGSDEVVGEELQRITLREAAWEAGQEYIEKSSL